MEKIARQESSVSSSNSDDDRNRNRSPPATKAGLKITLKSSQKKVSKFAVDAAETPKIKCAPTGETYSEQPEPPSVTVSRDVSRLEERKQIINAIDAEPLPLAHSVAKGGSISVDMKLGWRPVNPFSGAPIPLYYAYGNYDAHINYTSMDPVKAPRFLGPRIPNSLQMHRLWAKKELSGGKQSYNFKFPPRTMNGKRKRVEEPRPFLGMNPNLPMIYERKGLEYKPDTELTFDSFFESGNLDIVQKPSNDTYNLYMRCDTNTSGNHQWFYFAVSHTEHLQCKTVTFNICNFTKCESLYSPAETLGTSQQAQPPPGMRVIVSRQSEGYQMKRAGENHSYYKSNLVRRKHPTDPSQTRYYYQLTFTFEFKSCRDKVFFSYSYPYSFTKLSNFLKDLTLKPDGTPKQLDHFGQNTLCKSLSGVDVPILTVTSRILSDPLEYNKVKLSDFDDADSKVSIPLNRRKKFIVITSRVHPGEANASWMMHGFIKAIMGNSFTAQQLRKRIVFKIIPMINVDGVIAGNYRSSMAGADLNRRYINPDARLHPEICAIKELMSDLTYGRPTQEREAKKTEPDFEEEDILCMLDMHGHSRKKNVFIYGPQYQLSSEKYYRSRLLPKLLSEETNKFRYHSCQFKYEHSKRKTARIVLNQEFDIMNCFTLEASFHAYFDSTRNNFEFTERDYEDMGEHLVNAFYEYCLITEEEERRRELIRMAKKKKRRIQANTILQKVQNNNDHLSVPGNVRASKDVKKTRSFRQDKNLPVPSGIPVSRHMHSRQTNSNKSRKSNQEIEEEEKSEYEGESMVEEVDMMDRSPEPRQRLLTETDGVDSVGYMTSATHPHEDAIPRHESRGGVRNMKDLFKMLDLDENRRIEEEKVEEQELGFKPDKDEEDAGKALFEKGEEDDSDDNDDAELCGELKNELLSDICGTLNQFSKQYGGNTYYQAQEKRAKLRKKQMEMTLQKRKKKSIMHPPDDNRGQKKNPSSKSAAKRTSQSPSKNHREERFRTEVSIHDGRPPIKDRAKPVSQMLHTARDSRNGPHRTSTETSALKINEFGEAKKKSINVQMNKVEDYSQVKSTVPGHNVYQRPKDNDMQVQLRIMQRQRLAQQGVMNRIGMKQQAGATKIIPLRKFLESKYQGSTDERVQVDTHEVQLTPQFEAAQVAQMQQAMALRRYQEQQQPNDHIIGAGGGATPKFDPAQGVHDQTPQFAMDQRPAQKLDFAMGSPVANSTRHGKLIEPQFNQKYEFPQGWKIAPPNLSAMQIIRTFKKQIGSKNALSDDVSFVMTTEHPQPPQKSQMNMRSDQRVAEVRQSFKSLQHQTWEKQYGQATQSQIETRARLSQPGIGSSSPPHRVPEKAISANVHSADRYSQGMNMTMSNLRKNPDRYTSKIDEGFVFNPSHTFGDEFLLAGLIEQPSFGGTSKKPSYYTPGYPQSQKVSQVTSALPLNTNHNRGPSLPEIANSPPDSGWGQARVSHVSAPKVDTYRGANNRMAIFEGLKICEKNTEDAETTGLGSPLAPQQRQTTGQGRRSNRNVMLGVISGQPTQHTQQWAQHVKMESGERQLGGTKSMMKNHITGRVGVKLDVHKQNTKDLQAVKMRLPQRSQIDSILNHQNRNGGNFFQSVDTRVQVGMIAHQDDTADSHGKLRASIEGQNQEGPKWLNQGTRVLPSQAQVQQARGMKAAARRQQSERKTHMRQNQVRAGGQGKKNHHRRDTENIQIYMSSQDQMALQNQNPRRQFSMNQ